MELVIKDTYDLTLSKTAFVKKVLLIADKDGYTLDFSDKSGTWVGKYASFGMLYGSNLSFDEGIFELCRCFVLTRGLDIEIPKY